MASRAPGTGPCFRRFSVSRLSCRAINVLSSAEVAITCYPEVFAHFLLGMSFVEQLKSNLDIVEVVSQYVRLKRQGAGSSYTGLCPFHTEKSPSFNVHATHQFYKCFGCDAKGDLINFVMEIEGLTFVEALKLLSERYGIPMPQRQRLDDPDAQLRETLLEMHEIAARVFEDNLHGPAGADARRYLLSRGVSIESAREFRIGLAEPRGQQLVARLQKYGPDSLEKSGLVGKRQDESGFYDRFRNRLMFPIHNESGKVIAFGGRALGADDQPKYLNSPETKIYKKTFVLYNLHRAKAQARKLDRMILVEGYMDAVGIYQAGLQNVVASCGTSLTNEQVRSIKRQVAHTDAGAGHVVVNFDPDPGGVRGTERSIQMLLAEGLRVKVLNLPGDADPDEFIQQQGIGQYSRLCDAAPSYFHWLTDRERTRHDVSTAEGRAAALQVLWPTLERVHDKVERNSLMEEVAARLGIEAQLVRDQFRRSPSNTESIKRVIEISSSVPPNERLLLKCVLQNEDARTAVMHYLKQSGIADTLHLKHIFNAILSMEAEAEDFTFGGLIRRLEAREQKIVSELSFKHTDMSAEEAAGQALQCLRALETKTTENRRADLRRRIRSAESEGDLKEALRLADELRR